MKRLILLITLVASFAPVAAENKYLNIYPQMRSIGTAAPLYLSVFARAGKDLEIRLVPISRAEFEKYSVDPWSKSYQEILSKAKYDEKKAAYSGTFKAKTGANYYQIKHGAPAGYYLIAAKLDSEVVARSTVLISDIGVIARQSEAELLIQTVHIATGKAWPNLNLNISTGTAGTPIQLKSGTDGLALLKFQDHEIARDQIRIVATNGKQEAQVFSGQTPYLDSKYQVFIDTDRPIYKGNDKIEWFAVLKKKKADGSFTAVNEGEAEYRISLPDGKEIHKGKAKINAWGKSSGSFRAPPETGGFMTIAVKFGGENHQANVLVKDYVKPALSVEVLADQNAVVFGTHIKGKIRSRYLYGAIPEGAEVTYEVYKGLYRKPEFEIRSEEKFFDIGGPGKSGGRGDIVDQGKGILDKDGELDFLVKTEAAHKGSVFTIRATVVAKGSQGSEVDRGGGQAQVKVLAGSLVLSLRQDRFILEPGKEEPLRLRLIDIQEKPAAGQTIRVTVLEEKWKTNYQKNTTAEVEYLKVSETSAVSDGTGTASVPLKIPKEGHFQVIATVKDSGGNEISESVFYWVAGSSFALSQPSLSELSVKADKRFYDPGETARLLISSSIKGAEILLTAEADRIYEYKIFKLTGNSFLYDIKLDRAHVPNLYISASLVVDGRLVSSVLPVFVSPQNRFIKVELENTGRTYRPGDTVKMNVRTRDSSGNGVAASVGLAVVDEAVYLVQDRLAPSIEKFFYGRRPNRTRLSYSFPQIFTGGDAKDSPEPEADRTKFKDTAFFSGHVETDDSGKGAVEFVLPGNLTTWRATGIASDKGDRVGSGSMKFISTKELISRLSVPRFLNTASSGKITGIVQNLTQEPLEIEGYFKAKGLRLKGKEKFSGTVKPRQLLTFEVEVSSETESPDGRVSFFVASKDGRFKDSLEKPLPVHETGLEHVFASPGIVLNSAKPGEVKREFVIPVPDAMAKKDFQIREFGLNVVPDLGAAVTGSLEYLLEYPHGCVEQTTSRFLPNIEVLRFLKRHDLQSTKLREKLETHIRAGIQNLQALQNTERGGWGWWQSSEGHAVNHWMTAYALYGLVEAKKEGYEVDEARLKKGLAALQKMVLETGGEKSSTLDENDYPQKESFVYFANYILTRADKGDATVSDAAVALAGESHVESLGWALRTLTAEKRKKDFSQVRTQLVKKASNNRFSEELGNEQSNTSETHYNAIAISGIGADSGAGVDPRFMTQLLERRSLNGKFISTRDTAASVYAMLAFLDANPGLLKAEYEMTITYAPGKTETLTVKPGNDLSEPKKIRLDAGAFKKGQKITVTLKGKGLAQVYGYIRGFERTEKFEAVQNGIAVERHYVDAGKEPENSKFAGNLIVGDAIDVIVKIDMKDRSGNYLFVSESVPPGFIIESDFDYSYGRRNVVVTKDKIYFYTENYGGSETFRYRLRAVNPGSYLIPPARAELMYQDTINGSSGAEVIKVE